MKVSELIAILEQCEPTEEVVFQMDVGCCGDFKTLKAYDAEVSNLAGHQQPENWVPYISFRAIEGYHSCLQAGGTERAHKTYWEKVGHKSNAQKKIDEDNE